MRQPIVKDLRSKTKAKAKDFISVLEAPRGQGHGLEDFITANWYGKLYATVRWNNMFSCLYSAVVCASVVFHCHVCSIIMYCR